MKAPDFTTNNILTGSETLLSSGQPCEEMCLCLVSL